jgi:hypothetical protein
LSQSKEIGSMAEPGKTPKPEGAAGRASEELSQEELDQLAGGRGHHPGKGHHPGETHHSGKGRHHTGEGESHTPGEGEGHSPGEGGGHH